MPASLTVVGAGLAVTFPGISDSGKAAVLLAWMLEAMAMDKTPGSWGDRGCNDRCHIVIRSWLP